MRFTRLAKNPDHIMLRMLFLTIESPPDKGQRRDQPSPGGGTRSEPEPPACGRMGRDGLQEAHQASLDGAHGPAPPRAPPVLCSVPTRPAAPALARPAGSF